MGPGIRKAQRSVDAFLESIRRIIGDRAAFYGNPNTRAHTQAGHEDYRRNDVTAIVGAARVALTLDLRPALTAATIRLPALLVHGEKDPVSSDCPSGMDRTTAFPGDPSPASRGGPCCLR